MYSVMEAPAAAFAPAAVAAPAHERTVELLGGRAGLRTLQRRRAEPGKRLSVEQSGQLWIFAEVLARAETVFGSRNEAEAWLERPAIGLDQRRPIELLATRIGARMVEDHLGRLEYGVYA